MSATVVAARLAATASMVLAACSGKTTSKLDHVEIQDSENAVARHADHERPPSWTPKHLPPLFEEEPGDEARLPHRPSVPSRLPDRPAQALKRLLLHRAQGSRVFDPVIRSMLFVACRTRAGDSLYELIEKFDIEAQFDLEAVPDAVFLGCGVVWMPDGSRRCGRIMQSSCYSSPSTASYDPPVDAGAGE